MADLNRQLKDYLAESKSGGGSRKPLLPETSPSPISESSSSRRSWLSGFSSPSSAGVVWPWSSSDAPPAGVTGWSCLPSMSRGQRFALSAVCALLAALCFGLAILHVPLLVLHARKFALLWTLGSGLALMSAALLLGAGTTGRLLREPGALLYMASLGGTLYAALGLHSTTLTVLGTSAQALGLLAFLVALVPGGAAGLRYISSLCGALLKRGVSKSLPV